MASNAAAAALCRLEWRFIADHADILMPKAVLQELHAAAQDACLSSTAEQAATIKNNTEAIKALFWAAVDPTATPETMTAMMLRMPDAAIVFIMCMLEIRDQMQVWSPESTGQTALPCPKRWCSRRDKAAMALYCDLVRVSGIR